MSNEKLHIFNSLDLFTLLPFEREDPKIIPIEKFIKSSESEFKSNKRIDIYVHVPWCHKICNYCYCNKTLYNAEAINKYLQKIEEVCKLYFEQYKKLSI